MNFPKINPVIAIGSAVIIVGLFLLVLLSPLPLAYYYFQHQPDPNAICLYPPLTEETMDAIWGTIEDRTGIDQNSAVFDEMQVDLIPDGTVESLSLSFYATKDRKWYRYSAYLRYDPLRCGTLTVPSAPSDPPEPVSPSSQSPQKILAELAELNLSVFGSTDKPVFITTQTGREIHVTYYSGTCTDLFLLQNGAIIPLDRIVLNNTQAAAVSWNIFAQYCRELPEGYGRSCLSNGSILVFSADRLTGADYVINATAANRTIVLHECSRGIVQGQSCKSDFWGRSCINWTENGEG
ncbi:MAG TPA: hypothetical protein PKM50_00480 [Methanoregula sp.]|nr:hypothetical protein [Methanoregula sp.]